MQDQEPPSPRPFDNAVATFLRTVQTHHVALSQMADQKANILIASSFVVISILATKIHSAEHRYAIATLAMTTLFSALFAALVVLPRSGKKSTGPPNPLFFGCFARISREDFHLEIDHILASDRRVIHAMAEDIYQMGVVLHQRKYKFLGIAYRTFIGGLCTTALVAVIEMACQS